MAEHVKGALVVGAVVAARRLRDRGHLRPEVLEARLSKQALELVDQKIEVARWYPIAPFCELIELGWEMAAKRDPSYLETAGAQSADELFDATAISSSTSRSARARSGQRTQPDQVRFAMPLPKRLADQDEPAALYIAPQCMSECDDLGSPGEIAAA